MKEVHHVRMFKTEPDYPKCKIRTGDIFSTFYFIAEILFTLILRRKSKVFVPSVKFVSREETKSTTNLGVLFFISQISALVLFTTDNWIISHFIGPAEGKS